MNPLLLGLFRLRLRLGLAGLAGLVVAVGGLAIYLFAALPAERRAQSNAEKLAQLRAQPVLPALAEPPHATDDAALAEFYSQFPAMRDLPDLLKTLHQLARKYEIPLERGDFKFGNVEGDKLLGYEITLPVTGSYPQLRGFIDEAARKLPTMGLSEISLKREAADESLVQARLGFILYLSDN